jgi:hypothetical protein
VVKSLSKMEQHGVVPDVIDTVPQAVLQVNGYHSSTPNDLVIWYTADCLEHA